MPRAKNPIAQQSNSSYVIAPTPDGPLLGKVIHQSATGVVTLETEDGSTRDVTLEGRVVPVADPDLLRPVRFEPPSSEDRARAIEELIGLFRNEGATATDRRIWAEEHGAAALPDDKAADELIRYRYDDYRSQWKFALRDHLIAAAEQGKERLVLAALEPSVPTDARRVAAEVVESLGLMNAAPSLCAAAIHKTQNAFRVDAIRVLGKLAPERLPLIARSRQGSDDHVDASAAWRLPEAVEIRAVLDGHVGVPVDSRNPAAPADELAEVSPETLLHLATGLSPAEQVSLLAIYAERGPENRTAAGLRAALRAAFEPLAQKESPTVYEGLLRLALAQLVLADGDARANSDLYSVAGRLLARDGDDQMVSDLLAVLPVQGATTLVGESIGFRSAESACAMLAAVEYRRPELVPALVPTLRWVATERKELDRSLRVRALALLARDEGSHYLVAEHAEVELSSGAADVLLPLARSVAQNRVPLDLLRVRPRGRAILAAELKAGSGQYAARFISDLFALGDASTNWPLIRDLQLPSGWLDEGHDLRSALLYWLPVAARSDEIGGVARILSRVVEIDGPDAWADWKTEIKDAALVVLADGEPADAARALTAIASRLPPDGPERSRVVKALVCEALLRAPEVLGSVAPLLTEAELYGPVIARGVDLRHRIAAGQRSGRHSQTDAVGRLSADLAVALERALQAVGQDDLLGQLFGRLSDDMRAFLDRSTAVDPEVASYQEEFHEATPSNEADALLAALRRLGARSRSSRMAQEFFQERAESLLKRIPRESLEGLSIGNRKVLDRMDLLAIELLARHLIAKGSALALVLDVIGNDDGGRAVVEIALGLGEAHTSSAIALLATANIGLDSVVTAVAALDAEWRQGLQDGAAAEGGVADIGRVAAPTLDAIDGLLMNYVAVRRTLMEHGLEAIEPVLGKRLSERDLLPGAHRIIGGEAASGVYEVRSSGLRLREGGCVLAPASVARIGAPGGASDAEA